MISDQRPREAYVWIWLPGETDPVVAGRIERDKDIFVFNYGQSYLDRKDAIPIYLPELPLGRGAIVPNPPLPMANALRDAAPDAWGRRVIINRLTGKIGDEAHQVELDELTYLLSSGSDRIGALDFQASPETYVGRDIEQASLAELQESADRVLDGKPLHREIDRALHHGSAIGGARPKVLIDDNDKKYIAKFSSSGDTYSVVKAEFIAMRLAEIAGLNVAPVKIEKVAHKDVLLIERFDRVKTDAGWARRAMVSALTLFGLHEQMARYASYEELADIIRARFDVPRETLSELYARMVFNILVGNVDDHARNHAAFWDGEMLSLTPAYDICPQARTGREASQAMLVNGTRNASQLTECLEAAGKFHLSDDDALQIMTAQTTVIREHWDAVCAKAEVSTVDKALFRGRQFLNPFAFEGLEDRFTQMGGGSFT